MNPPTQPLTPYEQRLRDEVIYLHSLWHQGPPTLNPCRLNPTYNNNPSKSLLYVSNPTPFKQTNRRDKPRYHQKAKKKKNNASFGSKSDPQPDPGPEWPVNAPQPSSPPTSSGWPAFKPNLSSLSRPLPDSSQLGKITQHRVLKRCTEFFTKSTDLDSDEDGEFEEGDGDEEYWVHDDDVAESEEFKFLLGLFVDNQELRELYEKNQDNGDFYCLVCGGIGVKMGKTFSGCGGLVQHAIAIYKTKRKRAHRAFGHVICRVLGWDVSRLPVIVFKGEPLSQSLLNSGQAQPNAGAVAGNNGESVEKVVYDRAANEGEAVCKKYSKAEDGNKHVEDQDHVVSSMEASKDRFANHKGSESSPVSDVQWPCPPPFDKSPSRRLGLTAVNLHTTPLTHSAPAEELARSSMVQLQQKIVEECKKFLANPSRSDTEEDEVDGDANDLMDEDDSEECEEFKFFLRLFTEGNELRNYYENQYEGGEFYCLVCGSVGKKNWKKFKGCLGLIQHALAISRTEEKRAHRAYGQVICKVLGWDVDQIPTVVLKGEPLRQSLANSSIMEGEPKENADYGYQDSDFPMSNVESAYCIDGKSATREDSHVHQKNEIPLIYKNTLGKDNANDHVKDLDKENIGANKAGAVDSLKNLKEDGRNYKRENIEFWVNNYCWPEGMWHQSMIKTLPRKERQ